MQKTYVEILYPGAFVSGTEVRPVDSRDPAKFQAPEGCFGYRFFDREEVVSGDEVLAGKPKNYSETHYFGKAMTVDEVKSEVPNSRILVSNMQENGWDRVVKTRCGNFQPLTSLDTIVAEK